MNNTLKRELIKMRDADLATRERLAGRGELRENAYHPEMRALHERHNRRIRAIIAAFGWPGTSLVGEEGAEAAWLLLQHAVLDPELQALSIGLLQEAVQCGEAPGWHLAYLEDRVCIHQGRLQRYGTQHGLDGEGHMQPLPMEQPEAVDERRASVGLPPLAEHTRVLQRDYERVKAAQAAQTQQ